MTIESVALSIDYELFVHTPAYRSATGTVPGEFSVLDITDCLLSTLASYDATATFFVVSEIAEQHPEQIERIAEAGHEIASHTHTHRLLTELTQPERHRELQESREILTSVSGQPVTGFRAPAFDIPETHFEELKAAGYAYDSSIAPCRAIPGWYGGEDTADQPTTASEIRPGATSEFPVVPVSVMPGLRLPLTGAWTRLLGRRYLEMGLRWLDRRGITPVLYFHPWEFAALPDVDGVPSRVYWRTGNWLRRTLESVLKMTTSSVTVDSLASNVS